MLHVVIVNYMSARYLDECVASLGGLEAVIHVRDNASPDPDEQSRLQEIATRDPRVAVSFSGENVGFGAAANDLIASARGLTDEDLVWVLNPDTTVDPEAALSLMAFVEENPRSIASPVIVSGEAGEKVWFAGGRLNLRTGESSHFTAVPDCEGREALDVSFLTGAAIMTKVTTWRELGGFREDLFLYWEDADLCIRAARNNVTLCVVPTSVIWHRVGASSSARPVKSLEWYYYLLRNRLIVCSQAPHDLPRLVIGWGLIPTANHLYRALREPGPFWARVAAMVRGTRDGIRVVLSDSEARAKR